MRGVNGTNYESRVIRRGVIVERESDRVVGQISVGNNDIQRSGILTFIIECYDIGAIPFGAENRW